MNVEALGGRSNRHAAGRSFVRSALILAGSILAIAVPLCLLSIAMEQTGLSGPLGVALAAGVCLFAGWSAEALAAMLHRAGSPLGALMAGMGLRLLPPLAVCLALAVRGGGREQLAFVIYLLTFYFTILALDTWWAVRRVAGASRPSNHRPS